MIKKMKDLLKIKKNAFTLIELIVVIATLGILVLLAVPRFFGHTQDAELTKRIANTRAIEKASERYYMDYEDWPRLTDDPYTSEELEEFSERIYNAYGKEITLNPEGNYYNIDYDKLSDYVKVPDDKRNYILQNPVGKVYYMENLSEKGISRVDYVDESRPKEDVGKLRDPEEHEIVIETAEDLDNMRNNLSGEYILMADIDLKDLSWNPIGSSFSGKLDGNGFAINNLNITKESEYNVGLFAYTKNSKISNLRLKDVNITGATRTNGGSVGGLTGYSHSSVLENIHISGFVNGNSGTGGIVGNMYGSQVNNSSFIGEVNGDYWKNGGLVGSARKSSIKDSYVKGTVNGKDRYSGGLVGAMDSSYDDTSIENSYFKGDVFGSSDSGGLVGSLGGSSSSGGRRYPTVKNSYAVTGPSTKNPFGTRGLSHSINVLWDINTSESLDDDKYVGEIGLTTREMMKKQSYMTRDYGDYDFGPWTSEGWDFENVWEIQEGKDYPTLINNPER